MSKSSWFKNSRSRIAALLMALGLALPLAACDTLTSAWNWMDPFTETKKKPLEGTRIPVLVGEQEIKPNPDLAAVPVVLPPQQENADWPQSGGNPSHMMENPALADGFKPAWKVNIGYGEDDENPRLATPVVAGGVIYTMDTSSNVRAFDATSGAKKWEQSVAPQDVGGGDVGGELAFADGTLFVTNGYGEVLAIDATTDKIKWRRNLQGPTRSPPLVAGGRVFVITQDNQLHALDVNDGTVLWTHSGLSEVTDMLGAASPAIEGDTVIVPYTSGEIYALRADNGRVLWSDTLAAIRRADAISALADISANPVVDHDRVIAVGHSGRMVSIDLRSGARAWEDAIGGISQPWVAGKFVFVLSTVNQLICMNRDDGRIRWVAQLDRFGDPEKKKDIIVWHGPVLAGDKLLLTGTNAKLITVSPLDGKILSTTALGDPSTVPPVVAGHTLYILTSAGDLTAYR
jgi:outer membrane protein assembly factor BamB